MFSAQRRGMMILMRYSMKRRRGIGGMCVLAVLGLLAWHGAAGAAPARVTVVFVHPELYNDQDFRVRFSAAERTAVLQNLARHIERAGAATLAPGQTLRLEIFDIRRAGMDRFIRGSEVRVMTDVTPPTIALRYRLSGGGRSPQGGQEILSDMNYLMNPSARFSGDRFVYEKALIDDWLRRIAVR
jgi:hypothetical protein